MDLVNLSGFSPAWLTWKIRPPAWSLTVIVKGTFRLVPDGAAIRADKQLPATGDEYIDEDPARALRYENDFAPFKPKADLLLVGSCHAPGGKPVDACAVTFGVGKWSKKLAVAAIVPFTRANISYEAAYGGPRFKENPIGKEKPEIVYADRPREAVPAGFGPIPLTWPQRMSKAGGPSSYSKKWLKTRWPWWPEDFDWSFYNAAPDDQQMERLAGDEELVLENLHPKYPRLQCRLPGLRARVFVREKSAFHEIPMAIDTLWVDTDGETLVLVWRGHQDVRSQKLKEIEHLLMASEPLAGPSLSKEEYGRKLDEALAAKEKSFEPEKPKEEKPASPPEPPALPPEVQARIQAAEKQMAEAEKQIAEVEKQAQRFEAEAIEKIKAAGLVWPPKPAPPPSAAEIYKQYMDGLLKVKQAFTESGKPVPPKLDAAIRNPPPVSDFEVPEIPKRPEPPKAEEPPAPPPPPSRDDVAKRAAAKESFAGLDLTGLDLSGADLAGADLRGAILRDANLSNARLAGTDLAGAVLVGAKLEAADARSATFAGADLGAARMRGIDLSQAKLREALFVGADLTGARLAEADATEADFSRADLTRAEFRKAILPRAMLADARLDDVDFLEANLAGATLTKAAGKGVNADRADLSEVKAFGVRFEGGDFRKVRADGSIWEGAALAGANFSFARLRKAEFSSANLEGARLISADIREGRFVEANLRKADLTRANLFRGTIEKADLTEASLAEANLYEAETWEAVLEKTDLRDANVKMSKLAMKE